MQRQPGHRHVWFAVQKMPVERVESSRLLRPWKPTSRELQSVQTGALEQTLLYLHTATYARLSSVK